MKINNLNQNRLRRLAAAMLAAAALIIGGCTPAVQLRVERAPNWNTSGIKRVAVMPFEYSRSGGGGKFHIRLFEHGGNRNREAAEIANFLTTAAMTQIKNTNHFTLISAAEVERLRSGGESVGNHVDALFTGKVMSIESRDSSYIGQRYDTETKQTVDVTYYFRDVTLTISYSLERVRDGSLIGIATRTGNASDTQQDSLSLKSRSRLLQECRVLGGIGRDLAPYMVNETRVLMGEKTKDKELKTKMKNAHAQVTAGSYRAALNAYMKIYEEYGNIAAIYNAAIMQEALGDLAEAVALMERASSDTGNPRAADEIARLNRRIQEQAMVNSEYKEAVRPVDRVIVYASDEALKVLPQNAKVWFVNKAGSEQSLVDAVSDGMSAALIRSGVTVVDRENTALIEDELLRQMSGNVSDSDLLRVGNQAGANTIITIAVTGKGSMRRLQMRILDVEKGTPLLQSDAGGKWEL